jgi:ABC-2 type transport system permease protein
MNSAVPQATSHQLYWRATAGILRREVLRFLQQRERFIAALVRPLVWLFIFAVGFRAVLGVSITPPYTTYVVYDVYILPGLIAMIQLFNGMQGALAMVYDREMGGMRILLTSPLPRWFLLFARLLASTFVSLLQVYVFLFVARLYGIEFPPVGAVIILPALLLTGFMLGAIGTLLSASIRQLENFAGVMNFVIFPMFFASSALYPLWRIQEASDVLHRICLLNPFTYAVELIRFALYIQFNATAAMVVVATLLLVFGAAVWAYDPAIGLKTRNGRAPTD